MTPSHCTVSRQNLTIKTHWLACEGNSNWCGNPNALLCLLGHFGLDRAEEKNIESKKAERSWAGTTGWAIVGTSKCWDFYLLRSSMAPPTKHKCKFLQQETFSTGVLFRSPTGILGESFFQKYFHLWQKSSWLCFLYPSLLSNTPPKNVWWSYYINRDSVYLYISIMANIKKSTFPAENHI